MIWIRLTGQTIWEQTMHWVKVIWNRESGDGQYFYGLLMLPFQILIFCTTHISRCIDLNPNHTTPTVKSFFRPGWILICPTSQQDIILRGKLELSWFLSLLLVWVKREAELFLILSLSSVGWEDHPILHFSKTGPKLSCKTLNQTNLDNVSFDKRLTFSVGWTHLPSILHSRHSSCLLHQLASKQNRKQARYAMITMSHFATTVTRPSTLPMILIWSRQHIGVKILAILFFTYLYSECRVFSIYFLQWILLSFIYSMSFTYLVIIF